ncbi:hypothetical protein GAYE_PCTG14G0599 [Galdieria yellowstonensis]|uniref:Cyanobacterial aminoacyl-tRNA synthetase CAAD domain-containing protein n=1 Tax=Galdieria yellowstonensis TaxID=3028027 RepID=A0AAV9I678_9RHOD|nr:hypothetical protein GAYE_PCTG14G0599 [Galdieria yellowstonensis]
MTMPFCFVFDTTFKFSKIPYRRSSTDLCKPKHRSSPLKHNTQAVFFKETEKTKSTEPVNVTSAPNSNSKSVTFDGQLNKSASNTSPRTNISLDSAKLKEYSSKFLNDISLRPGFYGQLALAGLVGIICIQIIGSIEESLNRIPILPNVLELVGIAYSAYFAWRYVSYPETRTAVENTLKNLAAKLNK